MSLRVVFMGTPDFAVPTLRAIVAAGHEVVAAYTRAPAPGGRRGLEPVKSPVHRAAEGLGIAVLTPATLKSPPAQAEFAAFAADVAVVVAYGLLLPQAVLDKARLGCLNLHGSLLPRWRGAAPLQRALMAGDAQSGVMVMKMEAGLDTGPVGMVERIVIPPGMTAGQLHDALMHSGADLMARALAALARGALSFAPQAEEGVTYAAKITKEECHIDFARPARAVHDHIRALAPRPGAYAMAGGRRLKVLAARPAEGAGAPGTLLDGELTIACGEGAVRLLLVQPAGKAVMSAAEYRRGAKLATGVVLS